MQNKTISILIPTYQRYKMLARAIDSILSQSYKNFIVRVFDNGYDEETFSMMRNISSIDSRIEYRRNHENLGAKVNFQNLINSVDTQYYTMIGDDDFLLPGHLENAMRLLSKYPDAQFYSSATISIDLPRNKIEVRNQNWSENYIKPSRQVSYKVMKEHFASVGTIFSKDVINKMGCFHPMGMDDVLSVLLTGCFPFVVSPKLGAAYTINEKRERWKFQKEFTLEEILKAGSLDRKFVINYADPDTEPCLLNYLECYYGDSVEKKAIFLYRNNNLNQEIKDDYSKKILINYLFKPCSWKLLKMHASNIILEKITVIGKIYKDKINQKNNEYNLISNFDRSMNYLDECDISNKEKFFEKFEKFISKKIKSKI